MQDGVPLKTYKAKPAGEGVGEGPSDTMDM
jgi:hypothetical protein